MTQNIAQDFVYKIAASPDFATDQTCFSARLSGLYRSTDGGRSWRNMFDNAQFAQAMPATAVAVSPAFAQDQTVFASIHGAIIRSTDAGESWQTFPLARPHPVVTEIAVSPAFATDGMVVAATLEDGVFCSYDGGASWDDWNFGLIGFNTQALAVSPDFAQDQTVVVGNEIGVFLSTTAGRSWTPLAVIPGSPTVTALALSRRTATDQMLVVGTESAGVWITGIHADAAECAFSSEGEIGAIVLDCNDLSPSTSCHLLILHDDQLIYSDDGGQTWTRLLPAGDADVLAVAAPLGLKHDSPLLVGLEQGEVTPSQVQKSLQPSPGAPSNIDPGRRASNR